MALTPEDLQAIAALMEAERENTRKMIQDEREITRKIVQEELAAVKTDVAKIDKIAPKINGLYESVVGTGEKFSRLDLVENKVDDHDHRLFAVEETLKKAE